MRSLYFASLAVIPWVVVTLMLRWLINVQDWPVGLVGVLSRCVTVPLLFVWIVGVNRDWKGLRPRGRGGWLLLMGAISIVINLLWFGAVQWTTATNVGMLIRFDVLFVVLIGAVLGLERIGLAQLALLPPMFVGLALVVEIDKFDWGGHLTGDAMVVGAAFGFSINAFVIRHIMRVMDESPVALYNHFISALGFLGLALVMGDLGRTHEVLADPKAWIGIAVLGVLICISLPLYYVALRRMDVWKLRMFMLSTPVLTAAIEWPLWGARLSLSQILGACVILISLAVLIWMERRMTGRRENQESFEE